MSVSVYFDLEFPKQDGQNPITSSTTNPTSQPDSTSTTTSRANPGADPKPYAEMQSNEEAKLRYQVQNHCHSLSKVRTFDWSMGGIQLPGISWFC